MENNNQQPNPVSPAQTTTNPPMPAQNVPVSPVSGPTPVPSATPGGQMPTVKKPFGGIKLNPQDLKNKFNSFSKRTRVLMIVLTVMFLLIFILSIFASLFGKRKSVTLATPTPSPLGASPAPNVVLNASRYATDSGVLKLESDFNNLQLILNASDVKESALTPPTLDFNINFNK